MCGRYDNLIAREAYRLLFRANRLPQSNFPPRYNVAPTDQIPIIRVDPRDGERELVMARWGLVPNPLAAAIHDRMPVILEPQDYDRWLDPDASVDELRAFLKPYPADRMRALAVNRAVNSVKNDNEACIESIGEPPLQPA